MFRLGIAGVLISLGLMVFGFQEWRLSSNASSEPEEMTLAALIKRGPEGNPHIMLTDFDATDQMVYQQRKRGSSGWEKVWLPLVPLNEKARRETKVKALLYSKDAANAEAVEKLVAQDKLPGMVINTIETLGYKEHRLLQEGYTNSDIHSCIIFEPGRKPGGLGYVIAMVGGGVALFAVGFVLIVKGFSQA